MNYSGAVDTKHDALLRSSFSGGRCCIQWEKQHVTDTECNAV